MKVLNMNGKDYPLTGNIDTDLLFVINNTMLSVDSMCLLLSGTYTEKQIKGAIKRMRRQRIIEYNDLLGIFSMV